MGLINEFERVCSKRKLKVNVGKCRVMRCSAGVESEPLNMRLNGEVLEEVKEFKYMGSMITASGGMDAELRERLGEGGKVMGGLASIWKCGAMSIEAKMCLCLVVWRGWPVRLSASTLWSFPKARPREETKFSQTCSPEIYNSNRLKNV